MTGTTGSWPACWLDRGREGLARRFDAASGLCLDYDIRPGEHIRLRTSARGSRRCSRQDRQTQASALPRCGCSTPGTSAATRGWGWRLLLSTSPAGRRWTSTTTGVARSGRSSTGCCGARWAELGYSGRAEELRRDSLGQVAAAGKFAEYFEPFTGKPLAGPQPSWTAAVALDWSAPRSRQRSGE